MASRHLVREELPALGKPVTLLNGFKQNRGRTGWRRTPVAYLESLEEGSVRKAAGGHILFSHREQNHLWLFVMEHNSSQDATWGNPLVWYAVIHTQRWVAGASRTQDVRNIIPYNCRGCGFRSRMCIVCTETPAIPLCCPEE